MFACLKTVARCSDVMHSSRSLFLVVFSTDAEMIMDELTSSVSNIKRYSMMDELGDTIQQQAAQFVAKIIRSVFEDPACLLEESPPQPKQLDLMSTSEMVALH